MRRKIISISVAVFLAVLSWAIPYYLEVNNVITQENSYWLLIISIVCTIVLVGVLVWGFWPVLKRIRFQKPVGLHKPDESGVALSDEKRQLQLDLGRLLLDGKEILGDLKKMDAQLDSTAVVSAELKFEIWYKDVSKTLQNTDYAKLWDENKVGMAYHYKALKSDYVEACKYGLGRLEYIKQLMFDKEGSQPESA